METERFYLDSDQVEEVRIVWNEHGYKLIEVTRADGKVYTVESDN